MHLAYSVHAEVFFLNLKLFSQWTHQCSSVGESFFFFAFSLVFPSSPLGPSNFLGLISEEVGEGFLDVAVSVVIRRCGMICWLCHHWLWPLVYPALVWDPGGMQLCCPSQRLPWSVHVGVPHGPQALGWTALCGALGLVSLWRQCFAAPTHCRLVRGSIMQLLKLVG